MRSFRICRRIYKLTERDYKKLLKRLDASKAEPNGVGFAIRESCICPDDWMGGCDTCSLGPEKENCLNILSRVDPRVYLLRRESRIWFICSKIAWVARADKEVRAVLDMVRSKLLELPKL